MEHDNPVVRETKHVGMVSIDLAFLAIDSRTGDIKVAGSHHWAGKEPLVLSAIRERGRRCTEAYIRRMKKGHPDSTTKLWKILENVKRNLRTIRRSADGEGIDQSSFMEIGYLQTIELSLKPSALSLPASADFQLCSQLEESGRNDERWAESIFENYAQCLSRMVNTMQTIWELIREDCSNITLRKELPRARCHAAKWQAGQPFGDAVRRVISTQRPLTEDQKVYILLVDLRDLAAMSKGSQYGRPMKRLLEHFVIKEKITTQEGDEILQSLREDIVTFYKMELSISKPQIDLDAFRDPGGLNSFCTLSLSKSLASHTSEQDKYFPKNLPMCMDESEKTYRLFLNPDELPAKSHSDIVSFVSRYGSFKTGLEEEVFSSINQQTERCLLELEQGARWEGVDIASKIKLLSMIKTVASAVENSKLAFRREVAEDISKESRVSGADTEFLEDGIRAIASKSGRSKGFESMTSL